MKKTRLRKTVRGHCLDLLSILSVSQIIVGRAGIESAHRSTKATRLAMGARLVWKSRALPLPCHFAPVTTSRLLWNRKHLVTGVAWRGMARWRRVRPRDFSLLHRRRDGPRFQAETRSPSLDNTIRISENRAEANITSPYETYFA